MNKRQHLLNGLVVSLGVTALRAPSQDPATIAQMFGYLSVPIVLGTLLPDIDTEYGTHRKTGHNVFVLLGAFAYPLVFGNLHGLWIGVAAHLSSDYLGSTRGCAFLYPLTSREWSLPGGVPDSGGMRRVVFGFVCVAQLTAIYTLVSLGLYPW